MFKTNNISDKAKTYTKCETKVAGNHQAEGLMTVNFIISWDKTNIFEKSEYPQRISDEWEEGAHTTLQTELFWNAGVSPLEEV